MTDLKWTEVPISNVKKFQLDIEPEIIYVIKTGLIYESLFIVIQEDGYALNTGKSQLLTEKELLNEPNIKWS